MKIISKCEHGVYNPHGDKRYCTVCNPIPLPLNSKIEVSKNIKVAEVKPLTPKEEKVQLKFDKRLEDFGLGVLQPITDNSEGEMSEVAQIQYKSKNNNHGDMVRLRNKVDGSEQFMSGHQLMKIRSLEREIPEWALNSNKIQEIIERSFPNWRSKKAHMISAGRWVRIIYLYYRMQMPLQFVSKEMGMTKNALKMVLKGIRRIVNGRRFDNRAISQRPRGRPKNHK